MRILLVAPSESIHVNHSRAKKSICVALPLLAAYTPKKHDLVVVDEGQGENAFLEHFDLVALSAMTSQAHRAYKIAKHYRDQGVPVVMGGIHATVLPEEVLKHVDAICIGEGDEQWGQMIEDAGNHCLKRVYQSSELFPMEKIPFLRHEVLNGKKTTFGHTIIQASRGCPYDCDFCSVGVAFGNKYRFRPVENVIEEIKHLLPDRKAFLFVDDNIFGSPKYSEELFKKLIPLKIKWVGQASLHIATRDPKLLKLAKQSGCIGFFVGIESVNPVSRQNAASGSKLGTSHLGSISQKIKTLLNHGFTIYASVIFGLDGDDPMVFEKTVDFLKASNVSLTSFCILTPFPGTKIHEKLKEQGRLFHEDWSQYNSSHVVFEPKLMTARELKNGSDWAGKSFISWPSIFKRAFSNRRNPLLYAGLNIFTRRAYWKNDGPGAITPMSKPDKRLWLQSCRERHPG